MATKKVELRQKLEDTFDNEQSEIVVRSDWEIVDNKPDTFVPSDHDHDLSDLNTTGTASNTTYLRGDGSWVEIATTIALEDAAGEGLLWDNVNDEYYVEKATTTQAQAGINDTAFMTPLKTAQAIEELSPPPNNAPIIVSAGAGLTGGGEFTTNQNNAETITLNHADTSSQESVDNSNGNVIQDITLDTYGHVTALGSTNLDNRYLQSFTETDPIFSASPAAGISSNDISNWDTAYGWGDHAAQGYLKFDDIVDFATESYVDSAITSLVDSSPETLNTLNELAAALDDDPNFATTVSNQIANKANSSITITGENGLTGGGDLTANRTISHGDTSSQASVNNSSGTVIQDVTLDDFGHVTGLGSVDLDSRYYTQTESDSRFVNVTGDTMTGSLTMGNNFIYGDLGTTRLRIGGSPAEFVTVRSMEIRADDDDNSDTEYLKLMAGQNTLQVTSTAGGGTDNNKLTYNNNIVFHDGYHPNADKWTTARTFSLTGDVTGSTTVDGSNNFSITATVLNDSHTHDNRYYTETESDARYLGISAKAADSFNADKADYLDSFDTRDNVTTPQTHDKSVRFDFKRNSINGLNDGGTYNGVMYWRKYGSSTDFTGGGAMEIAYTDNGNLWKRYGTSNSWGSWEKIWDSGNLDPSTLGGGGYADGVVETNNNTNTDFWTGTQAQYDAIGTKDSNTLYFIRV